ncbi:Fic family protein [Rathayibacter sp. VKM Ac-2760]|uniref:Fic family protein n=1 Tax=Rathayibacter sp. VKM Ac-2760 TaxID=2609253 RepID=UPI0013168EF5|nr:Fic family protein [Rathayibacter sp. VKM Ac-2760]QHC57750.1 Fic family protein [Rathayibacter sp. VKM Ac-2760]
MTNSAGARPGRGRPSRDAVFRRFATAIDELANYGGLPKPHEAKKLWDDLWHLEAHHSTAIEGNTLVLREVEQLLEQGRAVGSKELKDYMEVLGYAEAARWVYQQAMEPTSWGHDSLVVVTEVRRIHAVMMAKAWDVAPHPDAQDSEAPGNWRRHEIHSFIGGMKPPTFTLVPAEVSAWVDRANSMRRRLDAGELSVGQVPEELAKLHREFEAIHPFIDGNGRSGRLLLNLLLIRLGWPPAIILKEQRVKYLRALQRSDEGDDGPLAEVISRSVIDNLHRLIPNIAGPAKYVPLEALADEEFSLLALRQAAARGRLEAIIGSDGRYRSSKAAVAEYRASKYTRTSKNL